MEELFILLTVLFYSAGTWAFVAFIRRPPISARPGFHEMMNYVERIAKLHGYLEQILKFHVDQLAWTFSFRSRKNR